MPKKGPTEEQIVAAGGSGREGGDICRKVGISEATYYAWKKQYPGLGWVSCGKRMGGWSGWSQISVGQADPAEDRIKKAVKPGLRRKLGQWAQQAYQIGQRRVARLMSLGWSSWLCRKKVRRFDEVLRRRLCEMATTHLRYGYRRLTVLLRREVGR